MVELNLVHAFSFGLAKKTRSNLEKLATCLVCVSSTTREDGWLYNDHFNVIFSAEVVLLSARALLASRCLQNSDLLLTLTKALVGDMVVVDETFLRRVITGSTLQSDQQGQRILDIGVCELLHGLEEPGAIITSMLKQENAEAGWIRKKWFSASGNKERLTIIEGKVLRIQVLSILDTLSNKSDRDFAEATILHAWGTSADSVRRLMKKFTDCITNPSIQFQSKQPRRIADDATYQTNGPSTVTPARTRRWGPLFSPSKSLKTPSTNEPHPQTPSTAPGPTNSLHLFSTARSSIMQVLSRKKKIRLPPVEEDDSVDNEAQADDEQQICKQLFNEVDISSVLLHVEEDSTDSPDNTDSLPEYYDDLPNDIQTLIDEQIAEDECRREDTRNDRMEATKKQRAKDAEKVLDTVCHLAAIGSNCVAKVMKAVLVKSMQNKHVTKYLVESGYPDKKKERVVERKKAANEARKRQAEKANKEPNLLVEEAKKDYRNPLGDSNSAALAQNNYAEYLGKGTDIPPVIRPTSVSWEKVDRLMQWVVQNCQFRPGKTRNVRFKKDKTYLKNLPLYMRYGSFHSLHSHYCSSIPEALRVGEKTFQKILSATTMKGTYNQGLSYYYVAFVDMIKLLQAMFDRLERIVKGIKIEKGKCQEIIDWLEHARKNTEFTSEYLRHGYYAEIQKSCVDGFTCAVHGLGEKCDHTHTFDKKSKLGLALLNHVLIGFVVELVLSALPDDDFERLGNELHSMFELCRLSGLETLHYTKHLVRGWWQDVAIRELKRLLLEFPWLIGVIFDHKNKLLPRCKDESMTMFFSKSGISILGALLFWAGEKTVKGQTVKGLFIWFLDIVMENTTAQEARDLMPGIEAIRSEIQEDYFIELSGGEKKGLFFLSDNALVSVSHSPFIHALNQRAMRVPSEQLQKAVQAPAVPIVDDSSSDSSSSEVGTISVEHIVDECSSRGETSISANENVTSASWILGESSSSSSSEKDTTSVHTVPEDNNDVAVEETTTQVSSDDMSDEEATMTKEMRDESIGATSVHTVPEDEDDVEVEEETTTQASSDDMSDIAERIDKYCERMRRQFSSKIRNWNSMVEPYIAKWLTWEAQRCKTQLDTHFAYINKQLTLACLEGGIDYLDPEKVFEALGYKGGSTATTTLLLSELTAAQDLYDTCNKAVTALEQKGINSVHDISFEPDKVTHTFFSNLERDQLVLSPTERWPTIEQPTGKVSKRHVNKADPLFFSFKEMLLDEDDSWEKDLDDRRLATRVYKSFKKHNADIAFATQDDEGRPVVSEQLQQRIDKMSENMQEAFHRKPELFEFFDSAFPCKLNSFWCKKRNRTHLTPSQEVLAELNRMFKSGQGSSNKAIRWSAERAATALQNGMIAEFWDQRLICNVAKIKSFFGRKFQDEQKENDVNRTEEDIDVSRQAREQIDSNRMELTQERGEMLLSENSKCEDALFRAMGIAEESDASVLGEAELKHFFKVAPKLLAAFIKCRVLDDACSASMENMPKKGTIKEAQNRAQCKKTKQLVMLCWAHDLRSKPVVAKVSDTQDIGSNESPNESSPNEEGADFEQDRILFVTANSEEVEQFSIFEDLTNNLTMQQLSGVEEVDDCLGLEERSDSDEDESDVECDSDDND
jgi:hypothetical protein